MPPTVEDRLRDILEAIVEIEALLAGYDFARFTADKTSRMATERYLEVICEAARRLPDEMKKDASSIDWQAMVNFGNRLRHAYHATDVGIVWAIVQDHLSPLKSFVEGRVRPSS
ncbi:MULTISPECIES: DUF86 domain-containing protein [Bradyrhizobium]|uniref:DUF86 domain-containing protein n=1 Tax=Bradyrhizobium yuanmingense TaxID=108015 RepID=A0A0R3CN95_9BRAD|nr:MULTISPECIES: DUF86 domain-containing protein [Bradyrhizobium]KRP99199.1 hypothetical protein AOQ72_15525 [Bradyrhizobium yuanmingense]MCA1477837.1 DUF86 domain-containing protein [Bradyrhizobium sp. NBAIM08]MCA1496370.1 DUF86 domain-containing protein [Bradyrhizobium sp. NBAIM14]MCA1514365.1 DUF86 domain-containing protein [Bradyrhizobium sp. NBAIM01]MCA1525118.1 DUF86 domain-containing protein [Bradyrhizobium yuanmingense]